MKRLLLYILLAVTLGVFAQQQIEDAAEAGSETAQAADAAQGDAGDLPENPVPPEPGEGELLEEPPGAEPGDVEIELPEEPDEAVTDESDFKPSEEISEDYPVPLPSDI